jgi:diacylglycerol O-acyltransferase / wax synthase
MTGSRSRRLARINHATTTHKAQLRAAGGNVIDILHLPLPLVRAFVRWGRRIGSGRINLSVSIVAGPATPLWLAGARVLEAVPVAPGTSGAPGALQRCALS